MAEINRESLEHLAHLARLELDSEKEDKFVEDLGKILDHFKELESLDTKQVMPMAGGTLLKNVFREDDAERVNSKEEADGARKSFPEGQDENGFLKVPPVFE